jgi:heme exporter protein D
MRLNDLNDGSIKTLLILGLIIANLVVASFPQRRHVPSGRNQKQNDEARINDP